MKAIRDWFYRFRGYKLLVFEAKITRASGAVEYVRQESWVKPASLQMGG